MSACGARSALSHKALIFSATSSTADLVPSRVILKQRARIQAKLKSLKRLKNNGKENRLLHQEKV